MARYLNWFQARALARQGSAIRREAWRKWLLRPVYTWFIHETAYPNEVIVVPKGGSVVAPIVPPPPIIWWNNAVAGESAVATTGVAVRRVVQNYDFGSAEFLAWDWTDEPWDGGSFPPGVTNPVGCPPTATPGCCS
jgi:hypothetical protein